MLTKTWRDQGTDTLVQVSGLLHEVADTHCRIFRIVDGSGRGLGLLVHTMAHSQCHLTMNEYRAAPNHPHLCEVTGRAVTPIGWIERQICARQYTLTSADRL
jgi:hypothetical protein